MIIVDSSISFGNFVDTVVDVDPGIMALDGGLYSGGIIFLLPLSA